MTKHLTVLITASLATQLTAFSPLPLARADIHQWEYINPANPSQGKQQSTTFTPDGAGQNVGPNVSRVEIVVCIRRHSKERSERFP